MKVPDLIQHTTFAVRWRILASLAALSVSCPGSAQTISSNPVALRQLSYADLVSRLTDLDHLTTLPDPGEKTAQWSSYDRASRYDARTGKYIRWDANGDGNGYIHKENDKLVLAEMTGPG